MTPIVRRLCERFDLLDVPTDDRRLHLTAVPRLGGVAIFLSCLIALSTLPFVDNLLTQYLREHRAGTVSSVHTGNVGAAAGRL